MAARIWEYFTPPTIAMNAITTASITTMRFRIVTTPLLLWRGRIPSEGFGFGG
jgi:hypothetical protein